MDILEKVRRLLALSQSDNIHEAAVAAKTAQKLMARHNIEAAMLEVGEGESSLGEVGESIFEEITSGRVASWKVRLAHAVSLANACQSYTRTGGGRTEFIFVGSSADTNAARYLASLLVREVDRLVQVDRKANPWKKGHPYRRYWSSFRKGASEAIAEKVREGAKTAREEARERAEASDRVSQTSTALVHVDSALARVDQKSQRAADYLSAKYEKMGTYRQTATPVDADGFARGVQAGRSVSLDGVSAGELPRGAKAGIAVGA